MDKGIKSAWIKNNVTHEENNTKGIPTSASVVWNDISSSFSDGSSDQILTGLAVDGDYIKFQITDKIKQGNAVIAVKDGDGIVMWSWHLWFAPTSVLATTECTNYQKKTYKFTKEPLGFAYDSWSATYYDNPRKIRVTVKQSGSNQTGSFVITQNPGGTSPTFHTTFYQFGRKDALPGTDKYSGTSTAISGFTKGGTGKVSYGTSIKNPGTFYIYNTTTPYDWHTNSGTGAGTDSIATYNNAWSANNYSTDATDAEVKKTVYDPCPAGYHMPASNAFTGFTTTGSNTYTSSQFNVSGSFDKGWNFYTSSAKTSTIFFPAAGFRNSGNGTLGSVGLYGYYWSAVTYNGSSGRSLNFYSGYVFPLYYGHRSHGYSVRPVQE
jgi:uncharacterized protein (TIGR02145 family)